jgi:hypothetical protein
MGILLDRMPMMAMMIDQSVRKIARFPAHSLIHARSREKGQRMPK